MPRGSSPACRSAPAATPAATAPTRWRSAAASSRRPAPTGLSSPPKSAADISRARFLGLLSSLDLACTFFASWEHAEGAVNLVEIDGFVLPSDPRLAAFRAQLGKALYRLLPFGGYAVPLCAARLAPGTGKG